MEAWLTSSEDRTCHFPRQLYSRYRHLLRYSSHASQSQSSNWIRLRCFLTPYLYLHVALYSRDQGVSRSSGRLSVKLTSSRSTAEIDELYERKTPAWRWGKTVTAVEEQMQAAVRARPAGEGVVDVKV
jgi:hypothetical protein